MKKPPPTPPPLWLLAKLNPVELVDFQAALVRRLLRMRCLERFRFGPEWLVAVDGVWMRTYRQKHCDKCFYQTGPDGTKVWFHAVLEAKLILSNGMCFSLASVPIENPGCEYDKQDCESKAFPPLAEKIKALYPRLFICMTGDSLYGCAATMDICKRMRWSYIVTFKEGRTPALWKRALEAVTEPEELVTRKDGTRQSFRWATMLNHEGHTVHAIVCNETKPDGQTALWAWLTDHRPDRTNVAIIANNGGKTQRKNRTAVQCPEERRAQTEARLRQQCNRMVQHLPHCPGHAHVAAAHLAQRHRQQTDRRCLGHVRSRVQDAAQLRHQAARIDPA